MTVPAGRPGTSGDSALFDHASDRAGSPLGRHPGYARHAHRAGGAAEQDPGLGVRQLCDAACRALSPAINDPYTAIQATEHLSVLYAAYAARPVGDQVVRDPTRSVLVAVPARSFAENIALGLGLIRRFGAAEPSVIAAVLRLLIAALEATGAEPDRWAAIEKEADLLVTAAERKIVEPVDLQIVHRERAALEQLLQTRRATVREALG